MMPLYNESFVKQCAKQDRRLQKQLFEELYPHMFRTVFRYLSQLHEAEDCVMKGFMKVFQNIEKFRYEGEKSFFSWVKRIMVNEALMILRQNNNLVLSMETDISQISVSNEALSKLNADEINSFITQLPVGYRTVFNLFVVEGYSHGEIAEMTGINESTSRTQLIKARHKLRQMIEQNQKRYGIYGG